MNNATDHDIQALYVEYLGRPADPLGLQFWLASQKSVQDIATALIASKEYTDGHLRQSQIEMVDGVYLNLFGRHAEADGLKFWLGALQSGAVTPTSLVTTIAQAAQNSDLVALHNKVAAATLFTNSLDTAEEILSYTGTELTAARDWLAAITDDQSFQALTAGEAWHQPLIVVPAVPTTADHGGHAGDGQLAGATALVMVHLIGQAGPDVVV